VIQSVCVFCGSSAGRDPDYCAAAAGFGRALAESGRRLVFGGGKVIGVIPRHLVDLEVAHTRLSDLRVVDSMHQRKQMLADRELLLVGEDPDVLLTALDTHVLPATPKWIDRTTT
jgi:predicted Rossmann-fold nucleotide-binding protein